MQPQMPSSNLPSEDINEGDQKEKTLQSMKVAVFNIKLPNLIGPTNQPISAKPNKLVLLLFKLSEQKSMLFAKPIP
jgi:hypothetical protein